MAATVTAMGTVEAATETAIKPVPLKKEIDGQDGPGTDASILPVSKRRCFAANPEAK